MSKIDRVDVLESARSLLTPWTTEDGRLFLDYYVGSVRRTMSVAPGGHCDFRGWFSAFCIESQGFVPGGDYLNSAQVYFSHWAATSGRKLKDFIRVGGTVDGLYLDIANDANDAWKISPSGIERVSGGPTHIRMLRGAGMLPLVEPDLSVQPSQLEPLLREFIHAEDDVVTLLCAWLLGSLRPEGPYPVLTISGEQGSGKSSILRLLRRIIDPHALDMRSPPEDKRDLQAMVRNSFCLAFDNVSFISNKMSDELCTISTGTGAQAAEPSTPTLKNPLSASAGPSP
jgi:putative DNA primase/helicase